MKKPIPQRGLFLGVLLFLFFSCSLIGGKREVSVKIPELPPGWETLKGKIDFILEYPGGGGDVCRGTPVSPGSRVKLPLPWEDVLPVLAHPRFPLSAFPEAGMRPAGAVFPLEVSPGGEFELSWESGFLADCLLAVYRSAGRLDWINAERLKESIHTKSPETSWVLDKQRIVRSLIAGHFSGGLLSLQSLYSPDLALPENWLWGDPRLDRLWANRGAFVFYPGFYRAIRPGGGEWLELQVDAKGWLAVFFPGGESRQGRW